MRPLPSAGRAAAVLVLLAAAAAVALTLGLSGHGVPGAAGLSGAPELVAQTDDSAPAKNIVLFGASPGEAAGEVWGIARRGGGSAPVVYSEGSGWTFAPGLQNAAGEPLGNFQLDTPEAFRHEHPSPLAGQMTNDGAGAMLGRVGSSREAILVRSPGGPFQEVAVPEGSGGLEPGEQLFGVNSPPLLAALEQGGGAGAFVVPAAPGGDDKAVLYWNGSAWSREPIEAPGGEHVEAIAISAASTAEAWLLAKVGEGTGRLALFRRRPGAGPSWQPVSLRSSGTPGEGIELGAEALEEPATQQAQVLTATSDGVWVDGRLHGSHASTTLFFVPEGEAASGSFTGAWCRVPPGASATAAVEQACAAHPLPEPLPTDFSRSFAWAGSGPYGQRVVTGIPDGQLLRLTAGSFELVNSLGGKAGAEFGSAFAGAADGWLGKELLPVHVTTAQHLIGSRLKAWPVPFRFALTALAPQPGVAIGANGSEALAVGDHGEVARYHPGEGWFPETLPGPGGSRQAPRLRAVAWPTSGRAFAVGDSEHGAGEMWLWRGETGLWEKDPAMPLNFRGNLLGIAFDPGEPSRGYAVGQQGVLLSYGKTWTQEPEEAIPPAARGASFTSIAFAGSEAIVAWRKLLHQGQDLYAGGIIANDGSGWHEDAGAAAVLGTNMVPWAVAALPDGGAAFTAQGVTQGAFIYERSAPGAPWQAVQYPGGVAPGQLALFREGGALRAIGTGGEPDTYSAEEESPPPPGFPPILINPYPLASDPERGVLRQTAAGWSDQEHEINDALEPPGGYFYWDTPYNPDPANAVMVDPTGGQGWAVGGFVDSKHALLDTADVYRYPADGTSPPGEGVQVETTHAGYTSVAVGGGDSCAAPCATRSDTGIGPATWMAHAVQETQEMHNIGAFLYTGPGVTNGALAGPPIIPVPWATEERYYAARATAPAPADPSQPALAVCAAPSPTDREGLGLGSESAFEEAFAGNACKQGATAGSYAFQEGPLRVIVIDTSLVQGGQRQLATDPKWLAEQLAGAGGHAIVVGNANLPREYAEGIGSARQLVGVIEAGNRAGNGAAAYFYDAPEQNVRGTLTGSPEGTPAYGSGTLGYINVLGEEQAGFIGQSGFLVAEVSEREEKTGTCEKRVKTATHCFPVNVKLVPNVAEVAVEAQQGTLLRRSQAASFAGLARRPRAGNRAHNKVTELETAPYVPIPDNCIGGSCQSGIPPEYEFHSSNTEYGEFVQRNLNSAEPNAVLHDSHGKPISQEPQGGKDGLFCAFNATPANEPVMVTLKVANLSYSLPVTIQAGSVRQPCGTTKLNKKASNQTTTAPPPQQAPPETGGPQSSATPIPIPAPSAPLAPAPPPVLHASKPAPFLSQSPAVAFVPPFVPVPLPTPARPTPPSGTSAVTSPVEAAQKEEEEEAAPESVDAAASAYRPDEHEPVPEYLLGLAVLAAFAGASVWRRRRPRRGVRIAPATITADRAQRRLAREARRRR